MAGRGARQELSSVENWKRIFRDGGVFSAAVCRLLVSRVLGCCELEDEMGQEGALAQARLRHGHGRQRRRLQNEALSGGVEQSTYLFVVVVGRDSFCVVVCLMRRQAREEVSALQGEVQSQASPKPARCQRGGRDPCSATKNNFVARLYVLVTVANYL